MEPRKTLSREKRLRISILAGGWLAFVTTLSLTVAFTGFTPTTLAVMAGVAVLLGLLVAISVVAILREWTPQRMPASYEKRPAERAQWSRWYTSLFMMPILMTNMAIIAASRVDDWVRKDHDPSHLFLPAIMPLVAVLLVCTLSPFPRGKPGTRERRLFERMNDELSVAHMGQAFRYGFFAALAGLTAVMLTALFAPKWVLLALIGAFWLATVTTLVRFGLLQRAAEPKPGED